MGRTPSARESHCKRALDRMAQSWQLALALVACACIPIAQTRKAPDTGGGGSGGGSSCEEVYITLYNSGETAKILLDYGQNYDDGVKMVRTQFNDNGCLSGGWLEPYFELGSCNETVAYDVCQEVNTMQLHRRRVYKLGCFPAERLQVRYQSGGGRLFSGAQVHGRTQRNDYLRLHAASFRRSLSYRAERASVWRPLQCVWDERRLLPELL